MLSKGKKIVYKCPNCQSEDIVKVSIFPQSFYSDGSVLMYHTRRSGNCNQCHTWWPWKDRVKVSIRKKHEINLATS